MVVLGAGPIGLAPWHVPCPFLCETLQDLRPQPAPICKIEALRIPPTNREGLNSGSTRNDRLSSTFINYKKLSTIFPRSVSRNKLRTCPSLKEAYPRELSPKELAQSFQRLGCEVTVVIGASGKIMGKEDDAAAELVPGCGSGGDQFSSWGWVKMIGRVMGGLWLAS